MTLPLDNYLNNEVMRRLQDGRVLASEGQIFSVDNPGVSYERNRNFWAADIDISCTSVYQDSDANPTYRRITMVTPRHAMGANHYTAVIGSTVGFVAMDNTFHTATVLDKELIVTGDASASYPDDMAIILLDREIPEITHCMVVPPDISKYLTTGTDDVRDAAFSTDKFNNGSVQSYAGEAPSTSVDWEKSYYRSPDDPTQLAMYLYPGDFDSSNPTFFIYDGSPILITCWHGSSTGPSYSHYHDLINAAITQIDIDNAISTGYQLTVPDFSVVPEVPQVTPSTNVGNQVSNNSDTNTTQVDGNEAIFGGASFWGDGVTWSPTVHQDHLDAYNGTKNLWRKWHKLGTPPFCHVADAIQYNVTRVLTDEEYEQNTAWAGSADCGLPVVPRHIRIHISGGSAVDGTYDFVYMGEGSFLNLHPQWEVTSSNLSFNGAWVLTVGGFNSTNPDTGPLPPEGAWPDPIGGSGQISLNYGLS